MNIFYENYGVLGILFGILNVILIFMYFNDLIL